MGSTARTFLPALGPRSLPWHGVRSVLCVSSVCKTINRNSSIHLCDLVDDMTKKESRLFVRLCIAAVGPWARTRAIKPFFPRKKIGECLGVQLHEEDSTISLRMDVDRSFCFFLVGELWHYKKWHACHLSPLYASVTFGHDSLVFLMTNQPRAPARSFVSHFRHAKV